MSAASRSVGRRAWDGIRARRTTWMTLGAVGFGALAVLGARNYITDRLALEKARLQPRHEMVELVVAKRDLRRGEVVGADTMAVRALPREYAPAAAVVPSRFATVTGARLLVAMKAGEPLMPTAVAAADAGAISARVRPGIRAMTIAVDEVNSLSGMLQPGDRIDLLLSVRPPAPPGAGPQPEVTRTVMQGVPVLATGRQSRLALGDEPAPSRSYTSITVEVDPAQAQKLVVAQRSGKLTAVLRNPEDKAPVVDRRLDVNMLLGLPGTAPTVPAAVVEVIVGGRGQAPAQSPLMVAANAAGPAAAVPAAGAPPVAPPVAPGVVPRSGPPSVTGAGDGVWIPLVPPAAAPLHR